MKTRRQIKSVFELFEQDLRKLFPNLEDSSLWKIRHAAIYGMAESPGTMGMHRPGIKTPIKNLYLSSDGLQEGRFCASQNATRVALECVDLILEGG